MDDSKMSQWLVGRRVPIVLVFAATSTSMLISIAFGWSIGFRLDAALGAYLAGAFILPMSVAMTAEEVFPGLPTYLFVLVALSWAGAVVLCCDQLVRKRRLIFAAPVFVLLALPTYSLPRFALGAAGI